MSDLVTARLRLRHFTPEDGEALAALHGDPSVMRFIDDGRPVPRDVVLQETLPQIFAEYVTLPDGFGRYAAELLDSGAFVGWFSLRPADSIGLDGGIELGYRLLPQAWGRGLATEGARALVNRAFTELHVPEIRATTMTVNVASRRVLEKVGLRYVRTFFEDWPEPLPGAEHGDVEYAVSRHVWGAWGAPDGP